MISKHPESIDAEMGKKVVLHAVAEGSEPLKYEWFKDSDLMDGNMTGTLTLSDAKPGETNGIYSCRVSNLYGNAISKFATVTVTGMTVLKNLGFCIKTITNVMCL